jgi:hypothetical protein
MHFRHSHNWARFVVSCTELTEINGAVRLLILRGRVTGCMARESSDDAGHGCEHSADDLWSLADEKHRNEQHSQDGTNTSEANK